MPKPAPLVAQLQANNKVLEFYQGKKLVRALNLSQVRLLREVPDEETCKLIDQHVEQMKEAVFTKG